MTSGNDANNTLTMVGQERALWKEMMKFRKEIDKPFRHLSFRSCAHAHFVGSPIRPSCATDRIVNSQQAIVGFLSCIDRPMHVATTYCSTMRWHYQEINSSVD